MARLAAAPIGVSNSDVSRETWGVAEAPWSEPNGSCGALIGSPCSTVGAARSGPDPAWLPVPPPRLSAGADTSPPLPPPWHPRRPTRSAHADAHGVLRPLAPL